MHKENSTEKGRNGSGREKAWNSVTSETKIEHILKSENSSGVETGEKKNEVELAAAERKLNEITKRTNCFTTFVLIAMTMFSCGILLDRGYICVSK